MKNKSIFLRSWIPGQPMKRLPGTTTFILFLSFIFTIGCVGSKSRLKVGMTAEGEVVEAEGLAPHNPSDIIQTKRSSLLDAQRNAVEKAVGVFVSGRTMVEQAVAIENNILAKTDGYIKKYDVLNEKVDADLYKTKIRALVAIKDLEADLKDMALLNTPELERPRIFVNLKETVDKNEADEQPASRSLEKGLIDQGFLIVTKEKQKEAELTIEGKASAFPFQQEGLGGFVSYRARLVAQVRVPGTKEVLHSTSKEASGLGGNNQLAGLKALDTVGGLASEEIGQEIAESWAKGKKIIVFVEGVKSFSDVDRVRKNLETRPGIRDLVLRLYDEEMAQFEVQLGSVKPEELANQIEKGKSLSMKVLESTNQSLRLRLN